MTMSRALFRGGSHGPINAGTILRGRINPVVMDEAGRARKLVGLDRASHGSQIRRIGGFFSKGPSDSALRSLEKEAARVPSDVNAESRFFRGLAKKYPESAIRRFDEGRHVVNEAIVADYIKAMAQKGRLEKLNLQVKIENEPIDRILCR
ncbi:unnamed protein product [Choristocarpus tenellus]